MGNLAPSAGRRHRTQRARAVAVCIAILCSGVVAGATGQPATAAAPRFLTFLFQRAQVEATDGCDPVPGAVSLFDVAEAFDARGLVGSPAVVTGQTNESSELCWSDIGTYASWDDLARLRDDHGWQAVSTGKEHADITTMTPDRQREESCGTLDTLAAHGHDRAWGLFGYPNNHYTDAIQTDLVSTCFAYGRKYVTPTSPAQNKRADTVAPWYQWSLSVNGGNCNAVGLACYAQAGVDRRYMSPTYLKNVMSVAPDEWAVVQMYRFVDGARTDASAANRWDCTDADWTKHWTSKAELYCVDDFLGAVDAFQADPANAGVQTTDPATVAEAWGRPDPNDTALHMDRVLGGPLHALIYPSGLEAYPGGGVVVADTGNNHVKRFGADGSLIWDSGGTGPGPAQLDNPRDVSVDAAGDVYVVDTRNFRISKFSGGTGMSLSTFTGPAGDPMNWPMGGTIATVPAPGGGTVEHLFVADTGRKAVRELALDGAQVRRIDPVAGTGCASFAGIRDATADSAGNVYVAGYSTNTVMKMSPSGACIAAWGTTGTGAGQFRTPYGVATARDPVWGREVLYVADGLNHRVQVFDLDGTYLSQFGSDGTPTQPGTFTTMRRASPAKDGTGDVWAADLWGYRVERWHRSTSGYQYAQTIGTPLPAPTDQAVFQEPRGVAFAPDGSVAVVDTVHHRFVRMSQAGALLGTCGQRGSAGGQFNWPRGIALDPASGNLWVADTKQNRIQVITPSCTPIARFGTAGDGPGMFDWPHALAIRASDGVAWVADTYNHRIRTYDVATRTYIASYGYPGAALTGLQWPAGIAVDPTTRHVFVADTGNNRIVELADTAGAAITLVRTIEAGFDGPEGVAVDSHGRLWVADTGANRVVRVDAAGAVAETLAGSFLRPAVVTVGPADSVYVSDTGNDRVVAYTRGGTVEPPDPDTTPPDAIVTTPTPGQAHPLAPVSMSGSATDDGPAATRGVASVSVAVQDRATMKWWQPGGGWGPWALLDATLANPGAAATTWSLSWPAPGPGTYGMQVRAADTSGNVDPTKPWVPFTVTGPTSDSVAPNGTVSTPRANQVMPGGPARLAGRATDDVGVQAAEVAIRDRTTGLWWQPGGGWGPFAWLGTDLAAPGTTDTAWSLTWSPPAPGNYGLMLRVSDTSGNVDPTKPWIPFATG